MIDLFPILLFDLIILIVIGYVFVRKLTFTHPLFIYLFFHVYSITIRGWELYFGALPMYSNSLNFVAVNEPEFLRAILFSDIALIFFGLTSWLVSVNTRKLSATFKRDNSVIILSPNIVRFVVFTCLPIGILFFITTRAGVISVGGYGQNIALWPIACLCLLVFKNGFKWYLLLPITMYLIFVGLQGYHRFMLILPILFLLGCKLQLERKKWPPKKMFILGLMLLMIFPQLKYIGKAFQDGNFDIVLQQIELSFDSTTDNSAAKGQFLDQLAGALSLTDAYGKRYYGETYLAIITLPIPRAIWPEKPGLADHLKLISTPERPFDIEGRIITYIGESYLNFDIFGVILLPCLLGWFLTKWYYRATYGMFNKLDRYVYLVFFAALIQVFRDGLTSFVMFTMVQNMPMCFVVILHFFHRKKLQRTEG